MFEDSYTRYIKVEYISEYKTNNITCHKNYIFVSLMLKIEVTRYFQDVSISCSH